MDREPTSRVRDVCIGERPWKPRHLSGGQRSLVVISTVPPGGPTAHRVRKRLIQVEVAGVTPHRSRHRNDRAP